MTADNTEAFAAEVDTRPSREELERQLAELDNESSTSVIVAEDAEEEAEIARPTVTVFNKVLNREITITRPTDVDVTFYQQNVRSRRGDDIDRLAATGDFCADFVSADDYADWEKAVRRAASRDPRLGAVFFSDALNELMEQILEATEQSDDDELKKARNRAERRAAMKAKSSRASKG